MSHLRRSVRLAAILAPALAITVIAAPADAGLEPFTEEAVARGLVYQMQNYPQQYGYLGFGCGFADLDGDGDPDAIIIGATDPDGNGPLRAPLGIFENDGTGNFIDHTATSGFAGLRSGSAFAAADYDGDGDLDLYVTEMGRAVSAMVGELHANFLLRNDGGFTFTDVTDLAMAPDFGSSKGVCWGDYDGDGWVDLYVCNYNGQTPQTDQLDNRLYRNLGNGTFEDTAVAQTVDSAALSFQAVWFDYDRDGDVDLYLSNDRGHLNGMPNQLWRNDSGQLVNVSAGSGADLGLFSMGVACGDFDGNRWPDLYTTNIGNYDADSDGQNDGLNPLFLNQGDGTFVESSGLAGVDQFITSWGSVFFDYDNDGSLDLYVNNMFEPNTFYRHSASFPCEEIAEAANVAGPGWSGGSGVSFSSAVADVDGDGDMDLLVNDLGQNVRLYINHEEGRRHYVRYRLIGKGPNTWAIGGNVDTRTGTTWQFREVLAGANGYLGQNELTLHIGLDDATLVDEAVVSWPGGSPVRTLTDLPVDQTWTIYPPARLGDADGDGDQDLSDYAVMAGCIGQAIQPGCEMMDFDGNSQIDADDASAFIAAFDGVLQDCDGDRIADLEQLLLDPGLDANANGIPDSCEALGDVNGDGVTDVQDLTTVILNWGVCGSPCLGDTNGDGTVGVEDLVAVILNFE